ncbi:MAG TPA: UPF0164 family protein [Thermoanaerobaculia bacterium]|nr:UPF0164 family protein [Thermoanaerobaculia bacterium]
MVPESPRTGLHPRCFAASLVVICAALPASAQDLLSLDRFALLVASESRPSFAVIGAGARAAGMGGAFTALADDASAASFNPAGLALLLTPEASLVLDGRSRHDDYAAFTALENGEPTAYSASRSVFDTAGVNFASFTLPTTLAERNLTLQLSYHRLVDFELERDRSFLASEPGGEAVARYHQTVDQEGEIATFALAAAYQATERLSVGLNLARWQGAWTFVTDTSEAELATGTETALHFVQDHRFSGWNLTAGFLLRYRYANVGASFRLPFDGRYQVDSRLTTTFESPFVPQSRLDGRLEWPGSYTAGIALKPFETWIVTADYAEYDWDDMVIQGLGQEPVSFFDLVPVSRSTTENRGQWRFGTEVTLLPGENVVGLRAGYFTEPRPERLAGEGEAANTRGWALGAGWRRGALSFDLAWQRVHTLSKLPQFVDPDAVTEGEVLLPADAEVRTRENRVFVSMLYRFPSRDALKKLFHFLFVGPTRP